jgi:hypothetical protein
MKFVEAWKRLTGEAAGRRPRTGFPLQPFNPSTLQPFNPSTLQPFNPSTLQPFNPSTLKLFNLLIQTMTFDASERTVLAGLADVLIPAGEGFPSASQAGVAGEGLDSPSGPTWLRT